MLTSFPAETLPLPPWKHELLPDEHEDILIDVADVIRDAADANEWLDSPNTRLALVKPRDLIGTAREPWLRNILRSIKYGLYS